MSELLLSNPKLNRTARVDEEANLYISQEACHTFILVEKPPLVNLGLVSMPPSSDSSPLSSLGRSICLNRIVHRINGRRKIQSCFHLTLTSYSVKSLPANGFMNAQAKGGFVVQEEKG